MNTPASPRRTRTIILRTLIALALTCVLVFCALGAWAVHSYGHFFGIWWPAPSVQSYGHKGLEIMDIGLHATGPEWDKARATAREKIDRATGYDEVDEILREALAVAGGKHSFLLSPQERADSEKAYTAPTASRDGCITTVTVPEFIGTLTQATTYANTLADTLADLTICGVIVDLRTNGGGDMGPMIAGLSPLLPDGTIASFETRIGGRSDVVLTGGAINGGGSPVNVGQRKELTVPVAILTSEKTASSGEQVLIAFAGVSNVRSFGQPTAGYASINQGFLLYTGKEMFLTTGTTVSRVGEHYGEEPITPDSLVSVDEAPEAATQWIRSQQ